MVASCRPVCVSGKGIGPISGLDLSSCILTDYCHIFRVFPCRVPCLVVLLINRTPGGAMYMAFLRDIAYFVRKLISLGTARVPHL